MKKQIYIVAALAATAAFTACNSDKKSSTETAPTPTTIEIEPTDEICEPVTADAVTDTTFTCGDNTIEMTLVDRIYRTRDDQFLSLSVMAPKAESALTMALTALVDTNLYYYTDARMPEHGAINTINGMTEDFDASGRVFIDKLIPEADAAGGNGGFNVTIAARPVYTDGRYVTYQVFTEAYTGGANAASAYYYTTYDSHSGMQLSFDQIVPAADRARVRQEIIAHLAERFNMSVPEYLDSVNSFMYLDGDKALTAETFPIFEVAHVQQGYVFSYPKGEIGPNSDGNIVITVDSKAAE